MTISTEFEKLKAGKGVIRKAIQANKTALTTSENFNTYPTYISGMTAKSFDSTGLIDYCEDYLTTYTVKTDTIRDYAFYDWTNLHYLILDNTKTITLLGTHAFDGTNLKGIYVPSSLVSTYKAATNWKDFASLITSGTPPTVDSTIIIEHLQDAQRTVADINGLTLEKLITDFR